MYIYMYACSCMVIDYICTCVAYVLSFTLSYCTLPLFPPSPPLPPPSPPLPHFLPHSLPLSPSLTMHMHWGDTCTRVGDCSSRPWPSGSTLSGDRRQRLWDTDAKSQRVCQVYTCVCMYRIQHMYRACFALSIDSQCGSRYILQTTCLCVYFTSDTNTHGGGGSSNPAKGIWDYRALHSCIVEVLAEKGILHPSLCWTHIP